MPADKQKLLPIAVPAVTAVILLLVNQWWPPRAAAARLEIIDLTVTEDAEVVQTLYDSIAPKGYRRERSRIGSTAIDITLRNIGTGVSVLHRADFRIIDAHRLCTEGAGPVVISANYDVALPWRKATAQTISIPIRQELRPQTADRFLFSVGLRRRSIDVAMLYELELLLYHDREDEPVEAGRILLAERWPRMEDLVPPGRVSPAERKCLAQNLQAVQQFTALEGARSPELNDFLEKLPPPDPSDICVDGLFGCNLTPENGLDATPVGSAL